MNNLVKAFCDGCLISVRSKPKFRCSSSIINRGTRSSLFDVQKMMFEFVRCLIKWIRPIITSYLLVLKILTFTVAELQQTVLNILLEHQVISHHIIGKRKNKLVEICTHIVSDVKRDIVQSCIRLLLEKLLIHFNWMILQHLLM